MLLGSPAFVALYADQAELSDQVAQGDGADLTGADRTGPIKTVDLSFTAQVSEVKGLEVSAALVLAAQTRLSLPVTANRVEILWIVLVDNLLIY